MLLLGCLLPLASAAVVTEVPPFLRGDIEVAYTYDLLTGSLVERRGLEDVEVAGRALTDHTLTYGLAFSFAPGAAAIVELPHTVKSDVAYSSLSEMVYDPETDSGTFQGTATGTPGTYVTGRGLGGVWIGVRGTPFSEAFTSRNNSATWLLEGAIRTADDTNYWTTDELGVRGAGFGGMAARLRTAFSKDFGKSAPYVSGTYVGEGPTTAQVVNPDGTSVGAIDIDPANHGDIRVGVELTAGENPASGSLFAFDLHTGVAYASYAMVPTSFYLPDVIDPSIGAVLQAEQMEVGAGLGIHWRLFRNLQFGVRGDIASHLSQRVEFPYPVYTGDDTVRITVGSNIDIRFR